MTVSVRSMAEGDLEAVRSLSGTLGYPVDADALRERFTRVSASAGDGLFVAEGAPGGLLGFIHVHGRLLIESAPHAKLAALVVGEAARRTGVGRALVAAAEDWARAHGFDRMRVRSNVTRTESHHFYPALGFTLVKTQHAYERRF